MKGLIITCVLILGLVSPSLCRQRWNLATENTYNVLDYGACGDGKSDDSQAFLKAWNSTCGANGMAILVIPPGKSFKITSLMLNGPCKATNIHIQLKGTIVAPAMEEWKDKSHWITISYVNGLTIDGGGGLIDGYGSTWWHTCGKGCPRPRALSFHSCNNLDVNYLSMRNSPGGHISINGCDGAIFSHTNIDAPPLSPNTDGFDISASQNILIQDSTITTGDDCIAINGGTSYINATRVNCGPGHGISIGSLGRNHAHETVEEIHVKNCTFIGTQNGARIKTFQSGSGYARKITFEQITLKGVHNPIIIDQNYDPGTNQKISAVQVSEVTYRGFQGTSRDEIAIRLDCSSSFGCFNLVFDHINIVSFQSGMKTSASCHNAHGTVTSSTPNLSCLLK